ncbi:hypothetical protein MTO96_045843 [Rhipicephalus appendiculatus]
MYNPKNAVGGPWPHLEDVEVPLSRANVPGVVTCHVKRSEARTARTASVTSSESRRVRELGRRFEFSEPRLKIICDGITSNHNVPVALIPAVPNESRSTTIAPQT